MATSAVINFFERLSDGWLFDASHLKRLWANLHKDKGATVSQLVKCLLVYISAPEKHESDKVIPRCMKEWAGLMPTDQEWKAWGEDIISAVLGQLAEWMPHAAKHSRVRVLDLIVSILRGLPGETSLDDGVSKMIVDNLREHLADKDDKVRRLSIIALSKLGFQEAGEGDASVSEIIAELTDALHSDISQDVRMEVANRLPLDEHTLAEVLRHKSERSAKVAAAVYDKVARDVPLAQPRAPGGVGASAEQRTSLIWYGLHEPRADVRKAAQGLLNKWFTDDAGNDVVALVQAFNPQDNAELCQLILDQLVAQESWDPQAWLQAETVDARSLRHLFALAEYQEQQRQAPGGAAGGSGVDGPRWVDALSPARVFVWVYSSRKVERVAIEKGRAAATKAAAAVAEAEASAGAQAETVLEEFLPTAQQIGELCRLTAEAGPSHRYATAQLLDLATLSCMNWVDACSRETAEATLSELIIQVSRPYAPVPSDRRAQNAFLPAASGGSGVWEAAVLRFAAAVHGGDGAGLVHGVLPLVLQLVEDGASSACDVRAQEEAVEGPLLEALTYLHLLMAAAGPGVPPSASASAPSASGAVGTSDGRGCGFGGRSSWTLAQAVDALAWTVSGHTSPAVRAAAIRCYVELCLREGGMAHLPRAVAMLAPLLPAAAANGAAVHGQTAAEYEDPEFAAQQQLPRRVALQGLMDLTLTWGEPALTAELRRAAAAVVRHRRIEDVTAHMATLGMDVDDEGTRAVDAAAEAPAGPEVPGIVPILLRLTEGVVRKLQGSDSYAAARGVVADALLGSARLVHGWSLQLRLNKRLRHRVVTAMKPRLAEQLLTRLLLARFSPAVELEPWLRTQVSVFFKTFQEAASAAGDEGAVHRRMLAGAFLQAARCAMALPAPAGAPATARGCAAPALMEFAGELLAAAAAKALEATADTAAHDDDDAASGEEQTTSAVADGDANGSPDAVVWLCELVLEELVRLGSPGRASLDTCEGRVRAYAAELCKTPVRLLPGLPISVTAASPATLITIRRLAYLGRRAALTAGESLVKSVVPDTAYKKLQDFVRVLEELQQVKTAPLSDEDAREVLQALRDQLKDRLEELPSLEDITADLEPDDDLDTLTAQSAPAAVRAGARAGTSQAGAKKRTTAAKSGKGGTTRSRGSAPTRTRQTSRITTSRGTAADSRRSDARNAIDKGDESDEQDNHFVEDNDSSSDGGRGRKAKTAATNAAKGRARIATSARQTASQDTAAISDVGSQPGRRSVRAAAAKAAVKLEAMRAKDDGPSSWRAPS